MFGHRPGSSSALVIGLVLSALFLEGASAGTAVWPQFRGMNGQGWAAENEDPPIEFGPARNVLWKTAVPLGHSSPCIGADRVFLTGFDKEKQELLVLCIGRFSGDVLWTKAVAVEKIEKVHPVSNPAASTPATDGARVYVYFGSCGLLCYDIAGTLQWTVPLPIPTTGGSGNATSPVVLGELVLLNIDAGEAPCLLAVDRHSGKTVWKQSEPRTATYSSTGHSTPVLWGEQVVTHRSGEIVAHALQDGTRLWWIRTHTTGVSTPVLGKNALFVGTWNHSGEPDQRVELPDFETLVRQYDKNGDKCISESEFPDDLAATRRPGIEEIPGSQILLKPFWRMADTDQDGSLDSTEWKAVLSLATTWVTDHGLIAIKEGGKENVTATHILWREKTNVPEVPSPLYQDGRVYMVNNGGVVSCMDAETGQRLYRERLGASGPYYASPVCAQGRIYMASGQGVITVLAAGTRLQILARNDVKEPIFATPAILGNRLFVRTTRHLYVFAK